MHTQKMTRRAWNLVLVAGVMLTLAACSTLGHDKFACPAPDGFTCMNPVEVYEATNDINSVEDISKASASQGRKRRSKEAQPTVILVPAVAPVVAHQAAAVGPDRCCNPVLTGIQMGRNDSLSLAAPNAPIAPTRASADAIKSLGRPQRAEVPLGDTYREAAKIMRIYVAPWQDEQGDLHMGGHIYTEVEPRKWRVGQPAEVESQNTFSLLKGQVAAQSDEVASGQSNQGTTTNSFTNPQL